MHINKLGRALGVMIGAAYGDSLGAAVEMMSLGSIRTYYGKNGIQICDAAFGHDAGVITDDTQMALATAQGILACANRSDADTVTTSIYRSYLAWYKTQSQPGQSRGPGSTCISALASGRMGTLDMPLNHSAGCGGIMRAHPIGIAYNNLDTAVEVGLRSALITHGGPNGYVPSGLLAMMVAHLLNGKTFQETLELTQLRLSRIRKNEAEGTQLAIRAAIDAPKSGDRGAIIDKYFDQSALGGGWRGHAALGIAVYAVLCSNDPIEAVKIAVNHSGDSDSTGSIAGAIVGAINGLSPFAKELADTGVTLERRAELESVAKALIEP